MLSPIQVGDAALGQMCQAAVFVVDHVLPSVSKYWFHWETDNDDLGPIMPEFGVEVPKKADSPTSSAAGTPAASA